MQRATIVKQSGKDETLAAIARALGAARPRRQRESARAASGGGRFAALVGWLRELRRRERERRELAAMDASDFGDLAVPPSLLVDEVRRWPWQKSTPQWGAVAAEAGRNVPDNAQTLANHREEKWSAPRSQDPFSGAVGLDRAIRSGWIFF
jgi:uncharacterized protein YjiS (DUF1127 family)